MSLILPNVIAFFTVRLRYSGRQHTVAGRILEDIPGVLDWKAPTVGRHYAGCRACNGPVSATPVVSVRE